MGKHMFPGVNGEAIFVGTILHSLDHTLMDWNLEDPLWLDVNDPEFHHMAELGCTFISVTRDLVIHFMILFMRGLQSSTRNLQITWTHASSNEMFEYVLRESGRHGYDCV